MELRTYSGMKLGAERALTRLATIAALLLTLIAASVFLALAEDTTYSDPAGQFTAAVPAGWSDESTGSYGLFTHANVSIYLISVEGNDIQASIDTAVAQLAPDYVDATQTPMGEFWAPSGMWTQIIYSLPNGHAGNAVAQSNGSATVVLLVTADSMAAMQAIFSDANAILASVSIEGVSVSAAVPETEAPLMPPAQGEITFPELTGSYPVGRVDYIWSDDSRDETSTPVEGDPRIVRVWIWYPAAPVSNSEIAPYLPDTMSAIFQQLTGIKLGRNSQPCL